VEELGNEMCPSFASLWWKDLWSLEERFGYNWFKSKVERKMGDGIRTSFWKEIILFVLVFRIFLRSLTEFEGGGGFWLSLVMV